MKKVTQTHRPARAMAPSRNIAPRVNTASAKMTPIQYWIESIHEECVEANPLLPDCCVFPGGAVSLTASGMYPTAATNSPPEVGFQTMSTTALRAALTASGASDQFGDVGVKEWLAYVPTAS
ncbi:hypothetical protein F5B22DRAFT_657985 [Xylaria bambusicola]|uniref:uncharacterized protein n=1 Tax=Xylaria bambusicola TaxID=326684 RepID=UPI0020086331|nr:uncharacterized protein F5B22DRAFT_657985 [Xylaria bambusicola]KAI0509600.1 hypothetical protein F5B22DRAFT_657985 [Xylaria bambusicola]